MTTEQKIEAMAKEYVRGMGFDPIDLKLRNLEKMAFIAGAKAGIKIERERADAALAVVDELEKNFNAIADNPTSDSTGLINNQNNWTTWAKKKTGEAPEKIAQFKNKESGGE